MSDRKPNDAQDMHWPIFWPDCGCAAHVFRREDATLIAAAPQLLTMLERLYSATYGHTDLIPPLDFEHARAAIAAAKGGAQ